MTFISSLKKAVSLTVSIIVLAALVLHSCKEEEAAPAVVPPEFAIHSVVPAEGVAGDTVTITVTNQGSGQFNLVRINGNDTDAFNIQDSVFQIVMQGTAGTNRLYVAYGTKSAVKENFFRIKPLEFLGISNPTIQIRPNGVVRDSIFVSMNNAPKNKEAYTFLEQRITNGVLSPTKDFSTAYLRVLRVTDTGVVLKLNADPVFFPGYGVRFFMVVNGVEYSLENLKPLGSYKILDFSYDNYPENEIILRHGNRIFSEIGANSFVSNVYLNGIKLKQNYRDPEGPDADGYTTFLSFALPANILPGEYDLTVFQMDGVTPVLADSTNKVKISDIYYCPENNSYPQGADINVVISPDLYIYRCYSCPVTVSLWDVARQTEFVCTIKSKNYDGTKVYLTITPPNDMPPNALYNFEMKTLNGYVYKPNPACSGAAVMITPN